MRSQECGYNPCYVKTLLLDSRAKEVGKNCLQVLCKVQIFKEESGDSEDGFFA